MPITVWTWSKVVQALSRRAALPRLGTHTFRHLCLTDLARAGWELHEIAEFAGHRNTSTTLLYIHLSGRDLSAKLARAPPARMAVMLATGALLGALAAYGAETATSAFMIEEMAAYGCRMSWGSGQVIEQDDGTSFYAHRIVTPEFAQFRREKAQEK